jgi:L-lysine exporter family protein LysE/ArgO
VGSGENPLNYSAALAGFLLGGGLIVAIGAQNAFVIRQGVLKAHVFWVCLFCAVCDAVLIWAGVFGLGALIRVVPLLIPVMTYGGAAFLIWYGFKAFRRAMAPTGLGASAEATGSLAAALLACAGFTLLNPHVYLDTVVLVGSVANARPAGEQTPFAVGASLASLLWFFGLGYGAKALGPWLGQPHVWRMIDFIIAAIMLLLAFKLLWG